MWQRYSNYSVGDTVIVEKEIQLLALTPAQKEIKLLSLAQRRSVLGIVSCRRRYSNC